MVDLDQLIDPSYPEFTLNFLISNLDGQDAYWDSCRSRLEITKADIKLLETSGFMSDIYLNTFTFNKSPLENNEFVFTAILKVPSTRKLEAAISYSEEDLLVCKKCLFEIHKAEVRLYTEVLPLVHSKLTAFIVPQVYASRLAKSATDPSGGFILMQELKGNLAGSVPLHAGLSKKQVESAIRAIAQFHALSLSLPNGLVDSFVFRANVDIVDSQLHVSDRLLAIPEHQYGDYFKENKQMVLKIIEKHGRFGSDQHKLFGTRPVLNHGDFWQSNLFFHKDENDSASEKISAVIDWQITYAGTGISDVVRLIYVGVDPELRRQNFEHWLNLYLSSLKEATKKVDSEKKEVVECPYNDISEIHKMFEHHRHYELLFVLFLFVNVLGGLRDTEARKKLLERMKGLFEDNKSLYV